MALAIEQYTPLDEDRWTLNQASDHLTVTLGYSEERALREMEQQRLAGHLVVQVYKVVDGKLQGDPKYLPPDKKHELFRHLGWVRPLGLKWPDFNVRCTVYRQRVLELWPSRLPASQQQPEDRAGPDPFKSGAGPPPASQGRPTKASKPDSGAKRSRKPSSAQAARDAAIKTRLVKGDLPGSTVGWKEFYRDIRTDCDAVNPKNRKPKRGFSDDAIKRVTRELMESLPRQA
jgi:hypothetical protein